MDFTITYLAIVLLQSVDHINHAFRKLGMEFEKRTIDADSHFRSVEAVENAGDSWGKKEKNRDAAPTITIIYDGNVRCDGTVQQVLYCRRKTHKCPLSRSQLSTTNE